MSALDSNANKLYGIKQINVFISDDDGININDGSIENDIILDLDDMDDVRFQEQVFSSDDEENVSAIINKIYVFIIYCF